MLAERCGRAAPDACRIPASTRGRPRRAVVARCRRLQPLVAGIGRHGAPDIRCRCGIYAARSLDTFERPRPAWPPAPVVGTVALWGTVIERERGWRGANAYPARLRLVCSMCAWFEPGTGVPEVVHRFEREALHALRRAPRRYPGPPMAAYPPDGHRPRCPPGPAHRHVRRRSPAGGVGGLVVPATGDRRVAVPTAIRVVPVEDEGRDAGITPAGAWRSIRDAWDLRRR